MRRIIPGILLIVAVIGLQPLCADQLLPLDMSGVPAFDRAFMQPYSRSLEVGGTAFELASLLTPVLLLAEPADEYLRFATMYGETLLTAYALKEWKTLVLRHGRFCTPGLSIGKDGEGDAYDPFPQGMQQWLFAGAALPVMSLQPTTGLCMEDSVTVASTTCIATAAMRCMQAGTISLRCADRCLVGDFGRGGNPFLHRSLDSSRN